MVAFPIFYRCLFNTMCPVCSCTSNDGCLHVSFLVSFANAAEGIDGSMLCALLALSDSANNSFASLLLSFLNLCITIALLGGNIPQHYMGIYFSLMVSPPTATFTSSSALSFQATPSCPGTHLKVMFLYGPKIVMPLACQCSALM